MHQKFDRALPGLMGELTGLSHTLSWIWGTGPQDRENTQREGKEMREGRGS